MSETESKYEAEHREVEINMPQVSLAGHALTQVGPMLICHSCPYEHSYSIPPTFIYKGNDMNGMPILEKL